MAALRTHGVPAVERRAGASLPSAVAGRHLPALDGLRAVAVAGVVAYHLGAPWASGGYLGVDLFFALSGFLITSLLVEEWARTGTIRLVAFWARRARRLLPALLVLLFSLAVVVVAIGRLGGPGASAGIDLSELRGDALATLLYVANWHSVLAHQSYFARFSEPSPLEHTWSLAIEEQFYLVWPLVLLGVLAAGRRWAAVVGRRAGWRQLGTAVALGGAVASAVAMGVLYRSGSDPSRIYYGTDTHAFDLLAGAVVAMLAAARPQPGPRGRALLHAVALPAAAGLGACWVLGGTSAGLPTGWMFDGGFALCAALAAVVIADVRQERRGPLGALLALGPLRWIGTISYGIYLWHWPVIVYLDRARTGLSGTTLDVARVACTLAVATASYYLVEQPIRRRTWTGWRVRAAGPLAALAGAVVTATAVVVATTPSVVGSVAPTHAMAATAASSSVLAPGRSVPGAGGVVGTLRADVPAVTPSDPLRVTVLGDSVARAAEPAVAAALDSTGEVRVANATMDGFGLTTDPAWRTSLPALVASRRTQLVLATWSWDDDCSATSATPLLRHHTDVCALEHPVAYEKMLRHAVGLMLGPGGAAAVAFLQFPTTGPVPDATVAVRTAQDGMRAAGEAAWDRVARSLVAAFPGRVLYLPVASSVLLDRRYSAWLPPAGNPRAPQREWVRVRTVDNVHLCPAGAARYADAVATDVIGALGLPGTSAGWARGSWTADAVYDTPPGACPGGHPAG